MSYLLEGEDKKSLAIKSMAFIAEYFGIEKKDLGSFVVLMSKQNTALANKKVLDKITGEK